MKNSTLRGEALSLIESAGFNETVRAYATGAWNALETLLEERNCFPGTVAAIDRDSLAALPSRLAQDDLETMLVALAATRVILLLAGHTVSSIEGLRVRTKRRRIAGAPNGKYRFVKILDTRTG